MHQIYCMNCFAMMPANASSCPDCGRKVVALSDRDYRDKLVQALRHPLADVRLRAVLVLGLRHDAEAASELVQCALRQPTDLTVGLEVVKSLKALPAGESRSLALREIETRHPAGVVRSAAKEALAESTEK